MRGSMGISRRLTAMTAIAAALTLAAVGPVAAYTPPFEVQTGQHGDYYVRDLVDTPAVTCNYKEHTPGHFRMSSFVIKYPYVWWPDTVSGNNHEHGTVGWRVRIQSTTDPNGAWTTVFTSSNQKATAYEDQPGYDPHDKAPFTKRTIDWNAHQDVAYRVKLTMTWYNHDGSVKGTLSHWYQSYTGFGGSDGFCINQYATL